MNFVNRLLQKASITLASLAILGMLLTATLVASAAPLEQIPIYTPTAGPDGRIIYIVQAGDTLLSISLLTNISPEDLRDLNNLTGDTIYEGQKLLLGLAGPPEVTFTPGPSPTPTPFIPTPTSLPGYGNICILLFNDLNGDSIRQEEEPSIPDGAISVGNRAGTVSFTSQTGTGSDPICFEEVPEGDFALSVAVPEGYNPTTSTSYDLKLKAGDETYIDFGAQASTQTIAEAPLPTGSGKSPLLGIVGGVFLLIGIGLAIFARRLLR